jgi:hypothetical protein
MTPIWAVSRSKREACGWRRFYGRSRSWRVSVRCIFGIRIRIGIIPAKKVSQLLSRSLILSCY